MEPENSFADLDELIGFLNTSPDLAERLIDRREPATRRAESYKPGEARAIANEQARLHRQETGMTGSIVQAGHTAAARHATESGIDPQDWARQPWMDLHSRRGHGLDVEVKDQDGTTRTRTRHSSQELLIDQAVDNVRKANGGVLTPQGQLDAAAQVDWQTANTPYRQQDVEFVRNGSGHGGPAPFDATSARHAAVREALPITRTHFDTARTGLADAARKLSATALHAAGTALTVVDLMNDVDSVLTGIHEVEAGKYDAGWQRIGDVLKSRAMDVGLDKAMNVAVERGLLTPHQAILVNTFLVSYSVGTVLNDTLLEKHIQSAIPESATDWFYQNVQRTFDQLESNVRERLLRTSDAIDRAAAPAADDNKPSPALGAPRDLPAATTPESLPPRVLDAGSSEVLYDPATGRSVEVGSVSAGGGSVASAPAGAATPPAASAVGTTPEGTRVDVGVPATGGQANLDVTQPPGPAPMPLDTSGPAVTKEPDADPDLSPTDTTGATNVTGPAEPSTVTIEPDDDVTPAAGTPPVEPVDETSSPETPAVLAPADESAGALNATGPPEPSTVTIQPDDDVTPAAGTPPVDPVEDTSDPQTPAVLAPADETPGAPNVPGPAEPSSVIIEPDDGVAPAAGTPPVDPIEETSDPETPAVLAFAGESLGAPNATGPAEPSTVTIEPDDDVTPAAGTPPVDPVEDTFDLETPAAPAPPAESPTELNLGSPEADVADAPVDDSRPAIDTPPVTEPDEEADLASDTAPPPEVDPVREAPPTTGSNPDPTGVETTRETQADPDPEPPEVTPPPAVETAGTEVPEQGAEPESTTTELETIAPSVAETSAEETPLQPASVAPEPTNQEPVPDTIVEPSAPSEDTGEPRVAAPELESSDDGNPPGWSAAPAEHVDVDGPPRVDESVDGLHADSHDTDSSSAPQATNPPGWNEAPPPPEPAQQSWRDSGKDMDPPGWAPPPSEPEEESASAPAITDDAGAADPPVNEISPPLTTPEPVEIEPAPDPPAPSSPAAP